LEYGYLLLSAAKFLFRQFDAPRVVAIYNDSLRDDVYSCESKGAENKPSFAAVYLYPPICHARVSIAIAQCRPLFAARIKLDSQAFAGHALSLCILYNISRHSVSFNK